MDEDYTVHIAAKEYHRLIDNVIWTNALEEAGIEEWDGIEDAREIFETNSKSIYKP